MKVIVDNHSIPEFRVQVKCLNCQSELEINSLEDLKIGYHEEGDQRGSWEEKHIEFVCPLCKETIRLWKSIEEKFPISVIRMLYKKG